MKILFYNPLSLRFGGGFERWIFEIVPELKKLGHEITIITSDSVSFGQASLSNTDIKKIIKGHSRVIEFPSWLFPIGGSPLPKLPSFLWLQKEMGNVDLIYFTIAFFMQDFLLGLIKLRKKTPMIAGIHNSPIVDVRLHNLYTITVTRRILRLFDACHVLNQNIKSLLESWDLYNVLMLPTGINVKKFKPLKNVRNDSFRVLFAGRLVMEKGIDILCRAISLFNESNTNCNIEFIIAGIGEEKIITTIQQLNKKYSNIKYLKYILPDKMPELYQTCNLFVAPSRFEAFPYSLLEAQACGLPVITTNIPGPKDIIIDRQTGKLIQVENASELAQIIKYFYELWINEPDKFKTYGVNARKNIEINYSFENYILKLNKFFRIIVEQKKLNSSKIVGMPKN